MAGIEASRRTAGNEAKDFKSENDTKPKDHHASTAHDEHKTPKKRRKVIHGNVALFWVPFPSPFCPPVLLGNSPGGSATYTES